MNGRWSNNTYIVKGTVVGTISDVGSHWYAYGCMNDWEDTDLGSHPSIGAAKREVENWVRAQTAEEKSR